ncbi:hypothetical protein SAG0170_07085 [Streptococcus agalactiae LDS 617]|nr:hypothetical protein SAG0170_07085 [Streptococcus agalactiae LDS 617]EPV87407.1 hypothetical protein SAG0014_05665 [Streptococcus agalactiae FSL S3-586]
METGVVLADIDLAHVAISFADAVSFLVTYVLPPLVVVVKRELKSVEALYSASLP